MTSSTLKAAQIPWRIAPGEVVPELMRYDPDSKFRVFRRLIGGSGPVSVEYRNPDHPTYPTYVAEMRGMRRPYCSAVEIEREIWWEKRGRKGCSRPVTDADYAAFDPPKPPAEISAPVLSPTERTEALSGSSGQPTPVAPAGQRALRDSAAFVPGNADAAAIHAGGKPKIIADHFPTAPIVRTGQVPDLTIVLAHADRFDDTRAPISVRQPALRPRRANPARRMAYATLSHLRRSIDRAMQGLAD